MTTVTIKRNDTKGLFVDTLTTNSTVVVGGTLVPNVAGNFISSGLYASLPLFILEGSPSTFCFFNITAASYVIARTLTDGLLTDFWSPVAPITTPGGVYQPHGAVTGVATATYQPVDLTGSTVRFLMRRQGQPIKDISQPAVIVGSPTLGNVQYQPVLADVSQDGQYDQEWEVTFPSTQVLTFPNNGFNTVVILRDLTP